jgi:hypothetical protein
MDIAESGFVSPKTHWYYQSKLAVLKRDLRRFGSQPLLLRDIGAGDGFFAAEVIEAFGGKGNCVDINYSDTFSEGNITFSKKSVMDKPNTVFLIDVLEHVANPIKLLSESLHDADEPCIVFLSVPAFRTLWSGHDEFLAHVDRFQLSDLRGWIASLNGRTTILQEQYLYSALFLPVFIYRRFRKAPKSDLKETSRIVNQVLLLLSKFDNTYIKNSFFGLSAYVVFRLEKSNTH